MLSMAVAVHDWPGDRLNRNRAPDSTWFYDISIPGYRFQHGYLFKGDVNWSGAVVADVLLLSSSCVAVLNSFIHRLYTACESTSCTSKNGASNLEASHLSRINNNGCTLITYMTSKHLMKMPPPYSGRRHCTTVVSAILNSTVPIRAAGSLATTRLQYRLIRSS